MTDPIRTLINEGLIAEHRKREGFKSAAHYARLKPEPGEIGSIAENGVCVERIIVVSAK